ncbi:MAG TPA: efflux transporter periplasmic adaptor subunit, partial [Pseudomonas sp.]|nr:efflux transporter periplasmic adaptor subunit [Pseudomonas sp.]
GVEFTVMAQLDNSIRTRAVVREVEPQADASTRTRRARLTLQETPDGFRLGTSISVTLSTSVSPHSEIPASALQEVDGKSQVWIVDTRQKVVNPREVQVLERGQGSVLLGSGVQPGERIVTAGVNSLKPGQKVMVDEEGTR